MLKIYVLICIKGSCIRYKINKVAEGVKHWGFAFTVYSKETSLLYIRL